MSLDITPAVPAGAPLIQGYGEGGFRIAGTRHMGSLIVWARKIVPWSATAPEMIAADALIAALAGEGVELLVIGCGPRFVAPPKELRPALKAGGLGLEWMDTGAACRTFNVLLGEERRAAAALIAV